MRYFIYGLFLLTSSILHAETLKIGTVSFGPPFEMAADNNHHFFGFDIDLMQEICTRIQASCQFSNMTFEQLFSRLDNDNIDLAIGAISITNLRQKSYLFSLPYLVSSGQFVTKKTTTIHSLQDIQGKKIGVVKGTVFAELIQGMFSQAISIDEFDAVADLLEALADDDVDIIMLDSGTSDYWVANNNDYQVVGKHIPVGTGYGIMANKKSSALIKRVDEALLSVQNDGTFLKIYQRYFSNPIKE